MVNQNVIYLTIGKISRTLPKAGVCVCGSKAQREVHSALWKFSLHFNFVFRTALNVLIKFLSSDPRFNRSVVSPLYLKFKAPADD